MLPVCVWPRSLRFLIELRQSFAVVVTLFLFTCRNQPAQEDQRRISITRFQACSGQMITSRRSRSNDTQESLGPDLRRQSSVETDLLPSISALWRRGHNEAIIASLNNLLEVDALTCAAFPVFLLAAPSTVQPVAVVKWS